MTCKLCSVSLLKLYCIVAEVWASVRIALIRPGVCRARFLPAEVETIVVLVLELRRSSAYHANLGIVRVVEPKYIHTRTCSKQGHKHEEHTDTRTCTVQSIFARTHTQVCKYLHLHMLDPTANTYINIGIDINICLMHMSTSHAHARSCPCCTRPCSYLCVCFHASRLSWTCCIPMFEKYVHRHVQTCSCMIMFTYMYAFVFVHPA